MSKKATDMVVVPMVAQVIFPCDVPIAESAVTYMDSNVLMEGKPSMWCGTQKTSPMNPMKLTLSPARTEPMWTGYR